MSKATFYLFNVSDFYLFLYFTFFFFISNHTLRVIVVLVLIFCTRYLVPGYKQTSIESGERLQGAMGALCEA